MPGWQSDAPKPVSWIMYVQGLVGPVKILWWPWPLRDLKAAWGHEVEWDLSDAMTQSL